MSLEIDWTSYLRVHSDRRNLVLHLIAVPLFAVATILLAVFLVRGSYLAAAVAIAVAMAAMAMQGRGHALEPYAPEPFAGPGNFLRRWFGEQFLVFPTFVVTGRWWQQFRTSGADLENAG